MRIFIFTVIMFFVNAINAQTKKSVNIPVYTNYKGEVDTSLWFKWKHDLAKQINLEDLQTSTDTFHFRLWTDIQALDIWTIDHSKYFGLVTNYAQQYYDKPFKNGIYIVDKIYSNQFSIDSAKARRIFNIIEQLSIDTFPSDDKINGWQQGFDGEEFLVEMATAKQYSFKTYWTPRIFAASLIQAKQIQKFIDYLYKKFEVYNYYKKLKLPEGNYHRDGTAGVKIKIIGQQTAGANTIMDLL